jgi:hypothetical protein
MNWQPNIQEYKAKEGREAVLGEELPFKQSANHVRYLTGHMLTLRSVGWSYSNP